MKTNHRRQFVDRRSSHEFLEHIWKFNRHPPSSHGVTPKYFGFEFTNGKRGAARAIAGAKKFIRTRVRALLKRQLDKEKHND